MSDKRIIINVDFDNENNSFDMDIYDSNNAVDIPAIDIPLSADPETIRKYCIAIGETIYNLIADHNEEAN